MNISKNLFMLLLCILIAAGPSCQKKSDPASRKKVAVLAEGFTFEDLSFLQSCKAGIDQAAHDFNLEVVYDIDTATSNLSDRINTYSAQKYDLIIAIGYMWEQALTSAARQYPESTYVLVDAALSEPLDNTTCILFNVDEASYPLGFLAAWWAEQQDATDPVLSFVGAMQIPQIRQFTTPFQNGVDRYNQQYNRSVSVIGDFAGDFFNPDLGKKLADSLIDLGADVVFGVGSETGNASLLQAKTRNKWGIGVDVDQFYSFPEVSDILLSSAMKGLDKSVYAVVKMFVNQQFETSPYYGNLANEGVGLAPFHDFDSSIADSIKLDIEHIKAGIIDHSISTGWE